MSMLVGTGSPQHLLTFRGVTEGFIGGYCLGCLAVDHRSASDDYYAVIEVEGLYL